MAEAEGGRSQGSPSCSRTRVVGFQPVTTVPSTPRDVRKHWGSETAHTSSPISPRGLSSSLPQPSTTNGNSTFPSKTTSPHRPVSRPAGVLSTTHLGPVITPARILSSDLTAKRRAPKCVISMSSWKRSNVNSGCSDAWTTPPPIAPSPPLASASGVSVVSFAAIQQQQREQPSLKGKPKQSLLDIQQEEEAQQVEIDFMKWWTGEEERLRLERISGDAGGPSSSSSAARRRRGGRRGGKANVDKVDDRPPSSTRISGKPTGRSGGHRQISTIPD